MKQLVFRICGFLLFATILIAAIVTSLGQNGGSYSDMAEMLEGEPSVRSGAVYYNRLTKKQQYIYDAVVKAADSLEYTTEQMPFVAEMSDITAASNAILNDLPEYFYIDFGGFSLGEYKYTEIISDEETKEVSGESIIDEKYTCLMIPYTETTEELKLKKTRLSAAISKSQSLVSGLENDLDKQTALHDYIISICEKSQSGANCSNVYGALVEGEANSEGYHKAFKLLLSRTGIISHLVYGEVSGTRSVWCTVLIGDKYYNTDVYEDDLDKQFDDESFRGAVTHAYMNLSDETISATHKNKSDELPKCTDGETYYTANKLVCANEGMTEKLISEKLSDLVKYKRRTIELYCTYDVTENDVETYVFRQFELLYPDYTCECKMIKPKASFDAYTIIINYLPKTAENAN